MKVLETVLSFFLTLAQVIFPRKRKPSPSDRPCPPPQPLPPVPPLPLCIFRRIPVQHFR